MSRLRAGALAPAQKPVTAALILGLVIGVFSLIGLTATKADAAVPPKPTVGTCYNYGWTAYGAWSQTGKKVSCSSAHTAKTIALGTLVSGTTRTEASLTREANYSHMVKTCVRALSTKLGSTASKRNQSAYTTSFYVPTAEQFKAGQRWFRCDVVLPGKDSLKNLPTNRAKFLEGIALTQRTRGCMSAKFAGPYSCLSGHTYKSISAFKKAGTTYPSTTSIQNAVAKNCPARTRAYSVVSRYEWQTGDHTVVCYERNTN
ncbi:septum formation family protein [Nocardioides sp. NPDC059952]|uniref:septum formation family protein n=1 Tax=Nocardioides sp. NPDC059952 TaxID=3347014 RepID=UPI003656D3E0